METNKQLTDKLLLMGCRARFRPCWSQEAGAQLEVRRPAAFVDGRLVGSEISFYSASMFRVWTPQVKKAKACAARHNLRLRVMDGECELFVPAHLADTLLPEFGAKLKRKVSETQRAALEARFLREKAHRNAVAEA